MEHQNSFVPLLLITALAVIIPVVLSRFRRLRLPIVVGEILAGVLIGTSGLNLVEPSPVLDFLAEFGFAFLMFLSGLEVDFALITQEARGGSWRERWRQPLPLALLMLGLTLLLALIGAALLAAAGLVQNALLMGLILSTTSLGIVAPVLKERQLLRGQYGQQLLIAASLADFVTLLLLTVVIAISSRGLTLDLLLIPALLLIFALTTRVVRISRHMRVVHRLLDELSHATAQLRMRLALALMVGWVVLAEALGVELILGAFLAGAIAKLIAQPSSGNVEEKLDAFGYGFFIPIFFIMVGVNLDLRTIVESPGAILLIPELLVLAFVVKIVPALLLRARYGWRDTLAGGFLLSARLSLIIAASSIALEIGAISEAVSSDIVLIAILTTTLAPLAFNRLFQPVEAVQREGLILVGANQMAELLVRRLEGHLGSVTVLDLGDSLNREALEAAGCRVIVGQADVATLAAADAGQAAALIALASEPETLRTCCTLALEQFGVPLVVASVNETGLARELRTRGVRVIQPVLATAMALEGALRFPTAFDVLVRETEDVEVAEIQVSNPAFAYRQLRQMRLPGNALVLSLRREDTVMVPHGETLIHPGDSLALIGSPQAVEEAVLLLSGGARRPY